MKPDDCQPDDSIPPSKMSRTDTYLSSPEGEEAVKQFLENHILEVHQPLNDDEKLDLVDFAERFIQASIDEENEGVDNPCFLARMKARSEYGHILSVPNRRLYTLILGKYVIYPDVLQGCFEVSTIRTFSIHPDCVIVCAAGKESLYPEAIKTISISPNDSIKLYKRFFQLYTDSRGVVPQL
jgi:hypothetical protein